jgi:FKBP-type peptidyl-prolyl cis-trans isomerase FkpA
MTHRATIATLLVVVASVGCGGGETPAAEQAPHPESLRADTPRAGAQTDSAAGLTFAPALGVSLDSMTKTASGVYVQDLEVGSGAIATGGKRVVVEYRAWLPNGTLYEERPNAEGWGASEFLLGESAPVPGLVYGMEGMRAGGVRRIVVPPEHGYGLVGRPAGVPAGSTLIFQVRLTAVRDE